MSVNNCLFYYCEHKMRVFALIIAIVYLYGVLAAVKKSERIVGGSPTSISNWPYLTSLLFSWNLATYSQACGGTILTTNAILSAAHCFASDDVVRWRARIGSTYANNGGVVHTLESIVIHENFNWETLDSDIAVLRTVGTIVYNDKVQPANIASRTYTLEDNEAVWAMGWGATNFGGVGSDKLQHVQIWIINQGACRARYAERGITITPNMLCSGWLDFGGRDTCQGDSGGPLIHNDVVVGLASWGYECGHPRFPGVNTRVSKFTLWIQNAVG